MKTYDNIYAEIISLPNLYRAYEEAKKGKKDKTYLEFEKNLHENLMQIHLELLSKKYSIGEYKTFFIKDYKKRKITAPLFRDMIVQHAIFNFLEKIYEPYFIYDSYACRKGKGTHKAFFRIRKFIRKHSCNDYFIKCDVTKYFYSIDHEKLKLIIRKKIKDKDVLWIIDKFIDSYTEKNQDYHIFNTCSKEQGKGIPIGNLLSQLFANIYLNELDYFVKHELRIKYYVRYVDDFVIIVKCPEKIREIIVKLQDFLKNELFLKLENRKIQANKISFGVDFVGYVGFKKYSRVRSKNYRRFFSKFKIKIKSFKKGKLSFKKLYSSYASYLGYLKHTNSKKIKEKLESLFYANLLRFLKLQRRCPPATPIPPPDDSFGNLSYNFHAAITSSKTNVRAVKRGGNWNNGANAGLFCANLNNEPSNTNSNIGFRCCSENQADAIFSRKYCQPDVQLLLQLHGEFLEDFPAKTRAGINQLHKTYCKAEIPAMKKYLLLTYCCQHLAGELLVSLENRGYASEESSHGFSNKSSISFGDKTVSGNIFFRTLSPEKICEFNFKANAKYGESLICVCNNFSAFGKQFLNSSEGIKVIELNKNSFNLLNSSTVNLDSLINLCSCFSNSVNKNSGAINSNFLDKSFSKNTWSGTPLFNNEEIKTFTSRTIFIFYRDLYLSNKDLLISSDISSALFSDNFDFETIFFNSSCFLNFSINSLVTNTDLSIFVKDLNSFDNSSGNLMQISSTIDNYNKYDYKKLSTGNGGSLDISSFLLQKINSCNEKHPFHLMIDTEQKRYKSEGLGDK